MANVKQDMVDYDKIASQQSFKQLVKRKNGFLWSVTAIFLIAYMMLPILTSYTTILHQEAFGGISWVWLYSGCLFLMTWGLCHFYVAKANKFDKEAKEIINEYVSNGGAR